MTIHTSFVKLWNIPDTQRNIFNVKRYKEKIKWTPVEIPPPPRLRNKLSPVPLRPDSQPQPHFCPLPSPLGKLLYWIVCLSISFCFFTVLPHRYMPLNKILFNVGCLELCINRISCVHLSATLVLSILQDPSMVMGTAVIFPFSLLSCIWS